MVELGKYIQFQFIKLRFEGEGSVGEGDPPVATSPTPFQTASVLPLPPGLTNVCISQHGGKTGRKSVQLTVAVAVAAAAASSSW